MPYSTIKEFCRQKSIGSLYEKVLLHKFYKDYYELIEEQKTKYPDKAPTEADKNAFQSTLLSENALLSNLRVAEDEIAQAFDEKLRKIEKKYSRKSFWGSVWASMVASLLFTVVLAILITMAQKQVIDWAEGLYKNSKTLEQTIPNAKKD